MRDRRARWAAYLVLAVLGVAVAAAGALVQGGWFPFGLVLAIGGTAALFYGGTRLTGARAGAAVPAVTWLLTVIALTITRPEGDAAFAADLGPYLYLMLGALSGVICATLPGQPGAPPPHVPFGKR